MAQTATAQGETITEGEVIGTYKQLKQEVSSLAQKIAELEVEESEHSLVISTLKPLDPQRKAFRLVGGVLVERTVGEVLPAVADNLKNITATIKVLADRLKQKEMETNAWQKKYNIRTHQEAMAEEQRNQRQQGDSKSSGVLA